VSTYRSITSKVGVPTIVRPGAGGLSEVTIDFGRLGLAAWAEPVPAVRPTLSVVRLAPEGQGGES